MAVCIRAWRYLGRCRPFDSGWGGPIRPLDIDVWIDRYGLDRAAAEVLRAVLVRLDNDFLEAQASRNAKG